MCEPAAQSAEEIEAQELTRTPLPLHARPEEPERVHVQREVPEAAVHEHVRADRPPLVAEILRLEPERELDVARLQNRELDEIDENVDRDQPLHRGREPRRRFFRRTY